MHGKKVWGYGFLTVVDIRVLYDIYLRINEGPTFINGNVKKALDRMGIKLMQWIRIAPNQDILQGYKSGQLDELDYELKYRLQLQNADVLGDWDKMLEIVGNLKKEYRGIVFLCYEKSGSFCHRHIFADYMKEKYNIDITELEV